MNLDETTLPVYAKGAAILGAGGGGSTRTGLLSALHAVEDKGPVEVISVNDVPDDELVIPGDRLGSPDALLEKLGTPKEGRWLRGMIEHETGGRVCAFMPGEVRGVNALVPVKWAARTGLPLVDADGVGAAPSDVQKISMHVAGVPEPPSGLVDERGLTRILRNTDALLLERVPRSAAVPCGGATKMTDHVFTGAQARETATPGSVSRALRIGQVLAEAPADRVRSLLDHLGIRVLTTGKVSDIERRANDGLIRGHAMLDGVSINRGRLRPVRVKPRNENLLVLEEGGAGSSVPDIITLLNARSGDVVSTESMRHGQRGTLVVLPAPDIRPTPEGLVIAGSRAFGYDFDYQPLIAHPLPKW